MKTLEKFALTHWFCRVKREFLNSNHRFAGSTQVDSSITFKSSLIHRNFIQRLLFFIEFGIVGKPHL